MRKFLDSIRVLQEEIRSSGLGGALLSIAAPKVLLLEQPESNDNKLELIFAQVVTEPEIIHVSRDLFQSGFYNQAVVEAFKALDHFIKKLVGNKRLSGTELVSEVFSPKDPRLVWSRRLTRSEDDEQKGYHFIFMGSFLGIRNPCIHELEWIANREDALDLLLLAQHLLRKVKRAQLVKESSITAAAGGKAAESA